MEQKLPSCWDLVKNPTRINKARAENLSKTSKELKRKPLFAFIRTKAVTRTITKIGRDPHKSPLAGSKVLFKAVGRLQPRLANKPLKYAAQPEATPDTAVINSITVNQPAIQLETLQRWHRGNYRPHQLKGCETQIQQRKGQISLRKKPQSQSK